MLEFISFSSIFIMFSTNQWAWDTQSGAWRADGPAKQARERRLQEDLRPHDWREEQRGHLQVPVVPVPVPIAFMIHRGGDGGLDNTLHWNINNSFFNNIFIQVLITALTIQICFVAFATPQLFLLGQLFLFLRIIFFRISRCWY